MSYQPEVQSLLDAYLSAVREVLGDNLVGAYLTGSLALGDFDPATSDIDILTVTESPLSGGEMGGLAVLHQRLAPSYEVPGRDYEVYYIDRATVRKFEPDQRHLKVGPDDPLRWTEHRPSWVIERWVVREHGVTLTGPDPKALIDHVSSDDLRWAAGAELRRRLANWADGRWPISEMARRGTQSFEVETVCRALYTFQTGNVPSKREAVRWALETMPATWHRLINWSQRHKKDLTDHPASVPEVLRLLRWAVKEAG